MKTTERQAEILNAIVRGYVDLAQPVSSQWLEENCDFGISPATIRIEMQRLVDQRFLSQPHVSAGRVPTDRGYRFFVNELLKENFLETKDEFRIKDWTKEEIKDTIKFIQFLTKVLSSLSSNLAVSYLFNKKILWKEGWEEILQKPELREKKFISDFTELLKSFEERIEKLPINSEIKIYIGRENPLPKAKDFSVLISRCHFPIEEGILAILGPKRMAYDKNISLLRSITRILKDF